MTNFLTEETPGKVMGLLGATLFSLAFMLGVSLTNASFSGSQTALVDPFSPDKVMAVIDTASESYSYLLTVNFIQPLTHDYAIYGDNLAWLSNESGLTYALGLESPASQADSLASVGTQPKVAGAYTQKQPERSGFGIDMLYSLLIR